MKNEYKKLDPAPVIMIAGEMRRLSYYREYEKQIIERLLEYSKKYNLKIDLDKLEVTDWGDLK